VLNDSLLSGLRPDVVEKSQASELYAVSRKGPVAERMPACSRRPARVAKQLSRVPAPAKRGAVAASQVPGETAGGEPPALLWRRLFAPSSFSGSRPVDQRIERRFLNRRSHVRVIAGIASLLSPIQP